MRNLSPNVGDEGIYSVVLRVGVDSSSTRGLSLLFEVRVLVACVEARAGRPFLAGR